MAFDYYERPRRFVSLAALIFAGVAALWSMVTVNRFSLAVKALELMSRGGVVRALHPVSERFKAWHDRAVRHRGYRCDGFLYC